jgi:hypothetical protein
METRRTQAGLTRGMVERWLRAGAWQATAVARHSRSLLAVRDGGVGARTRAAAGRAARHLKRD